MSYIGLCQIHIK